MASSHAVSPATAFYLAVVDVIARSFIVPSVAADHRRSADESSFRRTQAFTALMAEAVEEVRGDTPRRGTALPCFRPELARLAPSAQRRQFPFALGPPAARNALTARTDRTSVPDDSSLWRSNVRRIVSVSRVVRASRLATPAAELSEPTHALRGVAVPSYRLPRPNAIYRCEAFSASGATSFCS